MSAEQLAMRILADASGVSSDRLRKGEIDAADFGRVRDAAIEIGESPLYIDATGGISISKLAARARRLKRAEQGLDLIIVDYLQLVTVGEGNGQKNRVQEVSEITGGLKALAKELNVPIIALSQLSRQVEAREDKRPQLSDLRESGSIEQDADCVMFVYRESYYKERAEPREGTEEHLKWQEEMDLLRGVAEVVIGKQRHGPIGIVKLSFDSDTTKFGNLAHSGRYGNFSDIPE
jgi:replicative DNA helicase